MTATARSSAEELGALYGVSVLVIPPHNPCIRVDKPDLVFATRAAKHRALVTEIAEAHATGRPVLVGTSSVQESETLAKAWRALGIGCEVLNAKTDELEARIIADAGGLGAVTISTNMAGRGTDIRLGGADERDRDAVAALGGLYVIGTNRHDSRRIDDQLRGRAGRQGDPGASRFFLSLEDDLLVRSGGAEQLAGLQAESPDAPIDSVAVARAIARAQRIIEGRTFEIRATLWRYSSVVEQQRAALQRLRNAILEGTYESWWQGTAPDRYERVATEAGEDRLRLLETQVALFHVDQGWSEHLRQVQDVQESIRLVALGGRRPIDEFVSRTADAFQAMMAHVERAILGAFDELCAQDGNLDPQRLGIERPSSTWTYLINDRFFDDYRDEALSNMAFGAGAAFSAGPLLLLLGVLQKLKRRRTS